jgi:signal transduction histidine kinase
MLFSLFNAKIVIRSSILILVFSVLWLPAELFSQSNGTLDPLLKEYESFVGHDTSKLRLILRIIPLLKKVETEKTQKFKAEAFDLIKKINDPFLTAQTYYTIGGAHLSFGEHDQAINLLSHALTLFEKLRKEKDIARVYERLGAIYKEKKEHQKSKEYFEKAIAIFEKLGDKVELVDAYSNVASLYGLMGDVDKALEMLDESIRYSILNNLKSLTARSLGSKARLLLQKGQSAQALECLFDALRINEELGDLRSQLFNYQNIALVFLEINDYRKTIEYANKGLKVNETVKNKRLETGLNHVLCVAYSKQSMHREAIACYQKVNDYFKEVKDYVTVAENYAFIAGHMIEDQQYSSAFFAYKTLIDIYEQNNTLNQIPNELHRIGDLLLIMPDSSLQSVGINPIDRYTESLKYLEDGLVLATRQLNLTQQKLLLASISKNYEIQQQYDKAFTVFKKYIDLKDSISGDEVQKKMLKTELNYEYEKKELRLKYEQKLTEEQLSIQTLLTQKQKQDLIFKTQELQISNQEKELTHLAYLKEQAEKQEKTQLLALSEEKQKVKEQELATKKLELFAKHRQFLLLMVISILLLTGLTLLVYYYLTLRRQKRIISQQNQLNEHTIAILSHDIKEPLLGVQMLLRKLKKDDPYMSEAAESLEDQIASANSVLANLLKMKKVSLSSKKISNEKAQVNKVVSDVVKELGHAISQKGLSFDFHLEHDFTLPVAEEKLKIIISNLLSNAIKFSYEGQTIRIYQEGNGFCIQDFGVGIESNLQGHLMSEIMVSQLGTLKEKGYGMGLFLLGLLIQDEKIRIFFEQPASGGTIAKIVG